MSAEKLTLGPSTLPVPALMGILNVTPDSFSDGGLNAQLDDAVSTAETMLAEGADIIDVGGESTRPGAEAVSVDEELARVIPVVEAVRNRTDALISVDTSSPQVMTAAIDAGAGMINDVRALTRPGALEAVAERDVAVCLMHMRGSPGTMQNQPTYDDVVQEVMEFLGQSIIRCMNAGIDRGRLLVDPGFGFGKSLQHNLTLLSRLSALKSLGCPILVGISRKSMFQQLLGRDVGNRLAGTLAAGQMALNAGAAILRVHDVAPHEDLRRLWVATTDI
ncbi:MAG: dihydropteroate synthase [Lysobacterales bacterium]